MVPIMADARRATADDAPELVRLRAVMFADLDGDPAPDGPWRQAAERTFRARLAEARPTMAAFVVDAGDRPGLAACAVGSIEYRISSPPNPSGMTGWLFNVATDPARRRRGYSRACVVALLAWYREQGVSRVELRASRSGEPLYRSLGFQPTEDPSMRLRIG